MAAATTTASGALTRTSALAAIAGIGAALFFVPLFTQTLSSFIVAAATTTTTADNDEDHSVPSSFSDSLLLLLSFSLAGFWIAAWLLDARFTSRHWPLVMKGNETNVLVLLLARAMHGRRLPVFACHALFSFGAAAGLQALVTHRFDPFLTSCILAIFGGLHFDALRHSRAFVDGLLLHSTAESTPPDDQGEG